MSGVKVIRYLLSQNSPLVALVPASRIVAGVVPVGASLPAISIVPVSTIRRHAVAATATEFCTARVQVTAMVKTSSAGGTDFAGLAALLDLIRAAAPRTRATVNGVVVDSVTHEMDGPLWTDDTGQILMQSIDYMVGFSE